MANTELYIPNGLLEVSRGWQEVVDSVLTAEEKQAAGREACAALQRIDGFYGTQKVIVKSELAVMVKEQAASEVDESLDAVEFRDLTLRGWLGRASYVQLMNYGSIAWPVYEAEVLEHTQDIDPTQAQGLALEGWYQKPNGEVRDPLYLPVSFINYALCAA